MIEKFLSTIAPERLQEEITAAIHAYYEEAKGLRGKPSSNGISPIIDTLRSSPAFSSMFKAQVDEARIVMEASIAGGLNKQTGEALQQALGESCAATFVFTGIILCLSLINRSDLLAENTCPKREGESVVDYMLRIHDELFEIKTNGMTIQKTLPGPSMDIRPASDEELSALKGKEGEIVSGPVKDALLVGKSATPIPIDLSSPDAKEKLAQAIKAAVGGAMKNTGNNPCVANFRESVDADSLQKLIGHHADDMPDVLAKAIHVVAQQVGVTGIAGLEEIMAADVNGAGKVAKLIGQQDEFVSWVAHVTLELLHMKTHANDGGLSPQELTEGVAAMVATIFVYALTMSKKPDKDKAMN